VYYGSNLYRKDNPRWSVSNATATRGVLCLSRPRLFLVAASAFGICVSWLVGLPRRAGARIHAKNDAEALWWGWQVTERCGGLTRQYRDARFEALRHDPSLRRDGLCADLAARGPAAPQRPDVSSCGDL